MTNETEIRDLDRERDAKWKQIEPVTNTEHCKVWDGEREGVRRVRWGKFGASLFGPVYADSSESEIIE